MSVGISYLQDTSEKLLNFLHDRSLPLYQRITGECENYLPFLLSQKEREEERKQYSNELKKLEEKVKGLQESHEQVQLKQAETTAYLEEINRLNKDRVKQESQIRDLKLQIQNEQAKLHKLEQLFRQREQKQAEELKLLQQQKRTIDVDTKARIRSESETMTKLKIQCKQNLEQIEKKLQEKTTKIAQINEEIKNCNLALRHSQQSSQSFQQQLIQCKHELRRFGQSVGLEEKGKPSEEAKHEQLKNLFQQLTIEKNKLLQELELRKILEMRIQSEEKKLKELNEKLKKQGEECSERIKLNVDTVVKTTKTEISRLNAELESVKQTEESRKRVGLEEKVTSLAKQVGEKNAEVSKVSGELIRERQQCQETIARLELQLKGTLGAAKQLQETTIARTDYEALISEKEERYSELKKSFDELKSRCAECKQVGTTAGILPGLGSGELPDIQEKAKQLNLELQAKQEQLTEEIQNLNVQIQGKEEEKTSLQLQIQTCDTERKKLQLAAQRKSEKYEFNVSSLNQQVEKVENTSKQCSEALNLLRTQNQQLGSSIETLQSELRKKLEEKEELKLLALNFKKIEAELQATQESRDLLASNLGDCRKVLSQTRNQYTGEKEKVRKTIEECTREKTELTQKFQNWISPETHQQEVSSMREEKLQVENKISACEETQRDLQNQNTELQTTVKTLKNQTMTQQGENDRIVEIQAKLQESLKANEEQRRDLSSQVRECGIKVETISATCVENERKKMEEFSEQRKKLETENQQCQQLLGERNAENVNLVREYRRLQSAHTTLTSQNESLVKKVQESVAASVAAQESQEALKTKLENMENELKTSRETAAAESLKVNRLSQRISDLEKQINESQKPSEKGSLLVECENKIAAMTEDTEKLKAQNEKLASDYDKLELSHQLGGERIVRGSLTPEIESCRRELEDLRECKQNFEKAAQDWTNKYTTLVRENSNLETSRQRIAVAKEKAENQLLLIQTKMQEVTEKHKRELEKLTEQNKELLLTEKKLLLGEQSEALEAEKERRKSQETQKRIQELEEKNNQLEQQSVEFKKIIDAKIQVEKEEWKEVKEIPEEERDQILKRLLKEYRTASLKEQKYKEEINRLKEQYNKLSVSRETPQPQCKSFEEEWKECESEQKECETALLTCKEKERETRTEKGELERLKQKVETLEEECESARKTPKKTETQKYRKDLAACLARYNKVNEEYTEVQEALKAFQKEGGAEVIRLNALVDNLRNQRDDLAENLRTAGSTEQLQGEIQTFLTETSKAQEEEALKALEEEEE